MEAIGGRYHIIEGPLDQGPTAVYKAFDLRNVHGQVAVKVLPGQSEVGPVHFQRERDALQRLRHEHVVELLDTGEDESGSPYLVFPWLERRLQEELTQRGAMSWEDWWGTFGRPILSALEAAHQLGVHHRDLKPANVLVAANACVKVIDFGIAKLQWDLAGDSTVSAGSPPFTPRELVTESPGMTRDTHAWAALTVFALSGDDPYADRSAPYLVLDQARRAARSALPLPLRSIVDRCLDTDPAVRPLNALVLGAEIEVALQEAEQDGAALTRASSPPVYLEFRERAFEGLEIDLYLDRAGVERYLTDELAETVWVMSRQAGSFTLVTGSMSMRAKVSPDGGSLVVTSAVSRGGSSLDRDRDQGWPSTFRFALEEPVDRVLAADVVSELDQRVAEHRQARRMTESREQRARPFIVWRGLLALLRAYEESREDPVPYSWITSTRGGVRFHLERRHAIEIGQRRVATVAGGRDFSGTVIAVDAESIEISPDPDPRSAPSPASDGVLREDRRAGQAGLERQQRALDAVEYGRAARAELAKLISEPQTARLPAPSGTITFKQTLDKAKQDAVTAAMSSDDVLLVRGPPGTGKTSFITELVIQELRRNPAARVLVASQSHAAVDHALASINREEPRIRLLRVAREEDDRVAASSAPFVMAEHLAAWRRDVVARGHAALSAWAKQRGIEVAAVESATRLTALASELRQAEDVEARRNEVEEALAELRGGRRDATQGATTSQAIRERGAELEELREAHAVCIDVIREQITRLISLGQIDRKASRRTLSADELELLAIDRLPHDEDAADECRRRLQLLSAWHAQFGLGPAFQAAALMRSQVVVGTCVGLGGLRGFESVPFDLVIIDEASKATGPELLIPLARGKRAVLVGDDRQLPPYVEREALDEQQIVERGLTKKELTTPLFVTLAEGLPEENVVTLTHQHRMHPAIGRLVSYCFYDRGLTSKDRPLASWLSVLAPRPVTWLTTAADNDRFERRVGVSIANPREVQVIAKFLSRANLLAGAARLHPTVAILAGYSAQRDALETRIGRSRQEWRHLNIECHTVDAFQGRQADVVLYSLTRCNTRGQLGFVKDPPRLNVAFSRAQDALIIVGDDAFARQATGSARLRTVLDHISDHPDDCHMQAAETGG